MNSIKRIVGIFVIVCLLLCNFTASATFAYDGFFDVSDSAWYKDAVDYVYDNNLMVGTSDHAFSPNTTVTRAMFAQVLYRMAGSPAVNDGSNYADVPVNAWYRTAVAWASSAGIMSGYGNHCFGAGDPITREQMMTVLHRFDEVSTDRNEVDVLRGFTDTESISNWAYAAIAWGVDKGIMSGSNHKIKPRAGATRAEVAMILMRFCTYIYDLPEGHDALESYIDISKVHNGYVSMRYVGETDKKFRARVILGGEITTYVIHPNQEYRFCFPYGPGEYEIIMFENTHDTRYRRVLSEKVDVSEDDYQKSLLCPATYYNYDKVQGVSMKAQDLWDVKKTDRENAKFVFDWVASSFKYDMERMNFVESGYLPDLSHVLEKGGGVCLDYSSLYASMLRSQGVPCQIVVGNEGVWGDMQCHAWCRALIDGKWTYIDPTFGSGRKTDRDRFFDMDDKLMGRYFKDYCF